MRVLFCAFLFVFVVLSSAQRSDSKAAAAQNVAVVKTCSHLSWDTNGELVGADFKYRRFLPTDYLEFVCSCTGYDFQKPQPCPVWSVKSKLSVQAKIELWTDNRDYFKCDSFIRIREADWLKGLNLTVVNLMCNAPNKSEEAKAEIKKVFWGKKCRENKDCLFENNVCLLDEDIGKVQCQCVPDKPVPNFEEGKCYPLTNVSLGEDCNSEIGLMCESSTICEVQTNSTKSVCICNPRTTDLVENSTHAECVPKEVNTTTGPADIEVCDKLKIENMVGRPYFLPSDNPRLLCSCEYNRTTGQFPATPSWTVLSGMSDKSKHVIWNGIFTKNLVLYDDWRLNMKDKNNTFVNLQCDALGISEKFAAEIRTADYMEPCATKIDCFNPNLECRWLYFPTRRMRCACPEATPTYLNNNCYPAVQLGKPCKYIEQCKEKVTLSTCTGGICACVNGTTKNAESCYKDPPKPTPGSGNKLASSLTFLIMIYSIFNLVLN